MLLHVNFLAVLLYNITLTYCIYLPQHFLFFSLSFFSEKFYYLAMNVQNISIKSLIPHSRNPRRITQDQMAKLCASLTDDPDFLKMRPLLVYSDGESGKYIVYAGNQRLRAAKKLGWKTVPCIVDTDDSKVQSRMLKDNVSMGEWDFDILSADFEVDELLLAGFTQDQLHLEPVEDAPAKMPPEEQPQECPICGAVF